MVRYDVSIGVSRGSRCNDDYYRSMKVVVAGVIRVVVVIPSGMRRSTTGIGVSPIRHEPVRT